MSSYWVVKNGTGFKVLEAATKPAGEQDGPYSTQKAASMVAALLSPRKSTLEQVLGISQGLNNAIGLGAAAAGGGAALGAAGAALDLGEAGAAGEGATAGEGAAAGGAAGTAASLAAKAAGSTLLKDATLGSILGGLLTWGPLRMLELLAGVLLIVMGIKTLTGISIPTPV